MVWGRLGLALVKYRVTALVLACAGATGAVGCGGSSHANGEARAGEMASSSGGTGGGSSASNGGRPAESGAATGGATAGTMSMEAGGSVQSTAGTSGMPDAGMGPSESGGSATNGDGGTDSSDGAMPSPGCALANASPNLQDITAPLYTKLALPAGYDGVTPWPLLFDIHATNAGQEYSFFKADPLFAQRYILAGPEPPSSSVGNFESVSNFKDLLTTTLDALLATLCIDESRLFATGDGSGGRALTAWVAARDKAQQSPRFRALALVGTYYGRFSTWQPTPLLFAHALYSRNSMSVASDVDGTKAFTTLSGMNACGQASTPVNADRCPTQSSVDPGCVDLDGCAAPFRFCHYDGPAEEDLWPCFATAAVSQFFEPFRQ